ASARRRSGRRSYALIVSAPRFQLPASSRSMTPRAGAGSWQREAGRSFELIQHPPIFALDRIQQIDLEPRREHVPRVGLDLEVPGKARPAREIEDLADVILRRSKAFVLAREERHVKVDPPLSAGW